MTSTTNDGKDVKSNNTSGHKSKSHYIELYKSLDASLNSECDLGTLTGHVCSAWRRVHSLCSHSAPSTHPHLLAWIQRHTARTVLQAEWQFPTSKEYQTNLDQTLQDFVQETGDAIVARKGQCLQWESQLLERAVWFRSVLFSPWEHPVPKALLDSNLDQPTDEQVVEWLREERGVVVAMRVRQLALSKGCDDLALNLAAAVMGRVRDDALPHTDHDVTEKPPPTECGETMALSLRSEAGFTQDVVDLLTDIELVLLHKRDRDQCLRLAKATPLRSAHALVERLASRLDQAPRDKKLWKSAKHVASVVAQVIIARCMVGECCAGVARTALYWCARATARLVGGERLPAVVEALAAPAVSARHLHTLATAIHAQLAEVEESRGLVCELYIRAINSGMHELEKLKIDSSVETEKEARQTLQQTLASWFIQLGTLLSSSARVKCECALTAFSVHPSPAMYERIKQAPQLPRIVVESSETKQEAQPPASKSDFTSWATDSHQQTNLVKTSRINNIKTKENLANVLTTALFSEGEKLGLNDALCQDMAVLLSRPRVKTFSWDLNREVLLEYCRSYMERTSGGTKRLTTELRFLHLDPNAYQHLPTEGDDEDDIYYGIQKGYEHELEFEPQPEEIWQDALYSQQEESAESDPYDETYTTTTRRKKKTRHSASDSDPLSVVAKVKHDKKTEQPHNKQLSKELKQRGKKDPTKQNDKKERKEKKQTHKKEKQPKQNHSSELSKPVKSELSKFLGFKVVNLSFEDEFRNSLQRTQVDPLDNLPDPLGPDKKAQSKSTRLGTPVTDSDYDSQGKSSHKSDTPEPEAVSDKDFPVDDFIKSLQKIKNKPNPAVKESISKLLHYRKQKAEEHKNNASQDNSLASLIGSKICNKQPIMIPDPPSIPKPVLGDKSDASLKSTSTNTCKSLLVKPGSSEDCSSSSAPRQKIRNPSKPSTKKIKSEPSLNTNLKTNTSLSTITPSQKPTSTITESFAKPSFDPNQNSYQRFLIELQETKRLALLSSKDSTPAPKSINISTPKIIRTSESTQSAKHTQQKMETPNTFARRNHQHQTNKRIIQHQESLQFSISREIDQRIANLTQKKMKELQNANDLSIYQYNPNEVLNPHFNADNSSRIEQKVEVQKVEEPTPASSLIATNNPISSNALEGNVVTVARNPAYISTKPDQSKATPGHSVLSEQDQKDVLRLLMQQNKLNAKVESLAVRNTSIFDSQKEYPAKNNSTTNENEKQKQNLIYDSAFKQETMESPFIPHNTVMQTANMVRIPKPAPKRTAKVKNCPKKDAQSPTSLSANTSPAFLKAPANKSPVVLKTYGNSNQTAAIATDTEYSFAAYKSPITGPVSVNTNQTLKGHVSPASTQESQNSPKISTSGSQTLIKPRKSTYDMTATAGITSNLNENKVQPPYPSLSQQKEDWTSVLDGLLRLKTPCRPTALDMALNRDSKEAKTESLRKLRIVKSNSRRSVSLERQLETKQEIKPGQSSQNLHIPTTNMEKSGIKSPEPFTKDTFLEASKAVDDMIKKLNRKAKRRSRANDQPMMDDVRKSTVQHPKKDPIPSGLTRSDYDIMLGELLDDDLLQEIDESPVQCSRQNDSKDSYNNDLIFSKPEERVTIPAYGTKVEKAQIPVTQNLPDSNASINEKGQQHSKQINVAVDLPLNPDKLKILSKEKPRILSNVPVSLGSPDIKRFLDQNARSIIIPPHKTSPKIQHTNEILLKIPKANTPIPVQNPGPLKMVNNVAQNVFLVGSKNNYEKLTIYGQSEDETIQPLTGANANKVAKTTALKTPVTLNTESINKQVVIDQVVIKAPYPAVGGNRTIKTAETANNAPPSNKAAGNNQNVIAAPCPTPSENTPETVNTGLIANKPAAVFNAPYPAVGQIVTTIPETVNTGLTANKPAAVFNAPYAAVGQIVTTTPEAVNTESTSNKPAVVFNAPYPTVGQIVNTTPEAVNTESTSNKPAVIFKAPYPTVGQIVNTKPEAVNTESTSNKSAAVFNAPYPTVGQRVNTIPEAVNTESISNKPAVVFNAAYPTVGQIVNIPPEAVNTESTSNKPAVVFKAPYSTTGQTGITIPETTETINSASTPIHKHAVSTSVVSNATGGRTINIPMTSNVQNLPSYMDAHKSSYPVVGQTIKTAINNKSSTNVSLTSAQPVKAQITAKTALISKADPNLLQHETTTTKSALDIEVTPKVKQNIIQSTCPAIEITPKFQQAAIESTPKLEENLENTNKRVPVIEVTSNTTKTAVVELTVKSQNIACTKKPASVIVTTQNSQQVFRNTAKIVSPFEPKFKEKIANNNNDNPKINSDRKVLSEIPNNPSKIDIKNKTTILDGEKKKENQDRLIQKRLSIMNRQVDYRCYYPPIPLSDVPVIIERNVQKNLSITELDVEKSATNKLTEDIIAIRPSSTKAVPKNLVPTRVSKRIEMRKSTGILTNKRIVDDPELISKFRDKSPGSVAECDNISPEKLKLYSNVQLIDVPKHSNLTAINKIEHLKTNIEKIGPEIDKSTDKKINKLLSEMATPIDTITESNEPVVSEEYERRIPAARETCLQDTRATLGNREKLAVTTIKKNQVTKPKVILNKPSYVTNAEELPKETDNIQTYLKEANLLDHVASTFVGNAKFLDNNVTDAPKFENINMIDKEKETKEKMRPTKDKTEIIDLDSDSDTENEKFNSEQSNNRPVHHQKFDDSTAIKDQIQKSEILQSFKDSIRITEIMSDDREKRKVRIVLPNQKVFLATITGKVGNVDDLFAIPQLRNMLLNDSKVHSHTTVTITNPNVLNENSVRITNPAVFTNNYVETVDLLSDDEDTNEHQLVKQKVLRQYFVTEFGKFRTSGHIDKLMLSQHQQKFSQKCILKLQRCIESEIDQVQEEIQEEVLTLPSTDHHETSQEMKDTEPCVISEVIDLDDSSNDSVVAVEDAIVPNVAPFKKINKFKNLLLKELFSDNILNLNPDEIPTSEPKSEDSSSVVTILSSDVSTVDLSIQKQDYSKIIDKECVIKLTRCDDIVRNYKHKETEWDDKLEDVVSVSNNLELAPTSSSPALSRSGSTSILNELDLDTIVHSPVIDVFQALSELGEIEEAQREEVTSPVMQEYDIIVSIYKKAKLQTENTVQTVCETDWFLTKPKLSRLANTENNRNTKNEIVMNSKLDTSTEYKDSFNRLGTEKAQILIVTCKANYFMTKLQLHVHAKNLNKCEITTTSNTKLDNSTDCEDITDCSQPEFNTKTPVNCTPKLQTIMANYFADNPIVKNMQHIARLNHHVKISLKRKLTKDLTNKSSKISCMTRSQSDLRIDTSGNIPAPIEKRNNAFVRECKDLVKNNIPQQSNKSNTFTIDQNDNAYSICQKYPADHNKHELTKQLNDRDIILETCASEKIVSESIVKQDVCQTSELTSEIPATKIEPYVPKMCTDICNISSVEPSVKLCKPILEDSETLEEFKNKLSSKVADQKDDVSETINASFNIPSAETDVKKCVSLTMKDSPLHDLQDSEPIAQIYDQKYELRISETLLSSTNSPSVQHCPTEEPILRITESLVMQAKPAETFSDVPDFIQKLRVPETIMKVSHPLGIEPSVQGSVTQPVLGDTKSLHGRQDQPSSSGPIAGIHRKDEHIISKTIMEIVDTPSVEPCVSEKTIISNFEVKHDKQPEPILEIPDLIYEPCLRETAMKVVEPTITDPPVKASLSETILEDTESLSKLQEQNFALELITQIPDQTSKTSASEPVIDISESLVQQDKPCSTELINKMVDSLSVGFSIKECVSDTLYESQEKTSSESITQIPDPETTMETADTASAKLCASQTIAVLSELISEIPGPPCEPFLRETTIKVSDHPSTETYVVVSVSRPVLEDTKSPHEFQDKPSSCKPIAEIHYKDEPCISETVMEYTDSRSVEPCVSGKPIIGVSDFAVKQDKQSELISEIPDPTYEPCLRETTIKVVDLPSTESSVNESVSQTFLKDTKLLHEFQDKSSSSGLIAISEHVVKIPDPKPCVPEISMDNFNMLVNVCLSELISHESKSLNDLPKSNIKLTVDETKLQEEMTVSETTVADIISQEEQISPVPNIEDRVMEDRDPPQPLHEVSTFKNIVQNTKQEEYIDDIDWIGHECTIKNDSESANSSFESIPLFDFDDGKIYPSETKPKDIVDEGNLVLITDWALNPTLMEHAYQKIPVIEVNSNKIEKKSDEVIICTDTDEIKKDIYEPVVDKLILNVSDCKNVSENKCFNGDDTGVVLERGNSELECPFLGFEFPNTKSNCCIIREPTIVEGKGLECEKLYEDNQELTLFIPKVTYSMKRRKRKLVDFAMLGNAKRTLRPKSTDTNFNLGPKRKCIDARKLTNSAVNEQSYSKEFENLINYFNTIKLSYSLSFGVEHIDATELLQNWPIKDEYRIYDGELEVVELFTDDSETKPHEFGRDKPTFAEEINAAIEHKIETFGSADDTNFNKGFGERSGRVIKDLKQFGATSKLSAATLSDVKHYQPFSSSENINNINFNSNEKLQLHSTHDYEIVHRFMKGVNLHRKIKQFFKNSANELNDQHVNIQFKNGKMSKDAFPFNMWDFEQSPIEITVGVVQVGQLPVSAAAQNPVTCDPRVTHVSDASPSQCSENSPSNDPEQNNKTEYTELTTADISMPIIGQEYSHSDVPSESQDSYTPCENITIESSLIQSDIRIELEEESPEEAYVKTDVKNVQYKNDDYNSEADPDSNSPAQSDSNAQFVAPQQECQDSVVSQQSINGSKDKNDQIAQAMSVAGITNDDDDTATTNGTRALVDLLTSQGQTNTSQNITMTYPKTTTINAMSLQQALAQILPPPLNQTGENQQAPMSVPQVLHIVHNNSGGNVTLVDGGQQSVINSNSTPMIHIVQNKVSNGCPPGNGVPAQQQNSYSGLSLVDAGLQQGGGQLLHIVNTGNQKTPNTGQLLKRVNLLTNLTNVQGSNEQKMLQFVCKSADGKSIQLSSPHQRSMVLRLTPVESLDVPNVQKQTESLDTNSVPTNNEPSKEQSASQQEIKSRSVYEENYAKFIQNSSVKPGSEKSTSLPKFNQAFRKPVFQDGSEKSSDIASGVHENTDVQTSENTINVDNITEINNPPLLLRKTTAQVSQAHTNLVQQIKQTIAPMNIQTMHGGVIYTRQIPVNIGGGQTINLISVPTTELADESGQKQPEVQFVKQGDIDSSPSIIKIVPQTPAPNAEVSEDGSVNLQNDGQNPQPQPVLTQMRIKLPMLSKTSQMIAGARVVRPSFFQIQRNVIGGTNQPVYQQLVLTTAPQLGQQTVRLPQAQQVRQVKVPDNQSPQDSQMSSSTLEQLREFDMVLEQVKERSTVQPNSSASSTFPGNNTSADTTDSPVSTSSKPTETKQILYAIGGNHSVAYVNRKTIVTTASTPNITRVPDSSGTVDSPASSGQIQLATSETPQTVHNDGNPTPPKSKSHKSKSKSKSSSHSSHSSSKVNTAVTHKPSTQKPLEDEQTTQRILYILAEYKEQVENSPDKDKPAPRRRTNPPSNPGSRRKKRRSGARDVSPSGDDSRTLGSEDSSCGTSQGDCAESCVDSVSPQSSPRKVVRKLTFDPDATPNAISTTPIRPQPPRNVIVADGQTLAVARGAPGKPATAVIMPANYLLPVSMVKGGQQIAIVTNQGPKLLTVTGGESPAANALLLQRLIGPAVKPVLARPGIRHVRLPTAALQRIQTFNLASTATAAANNPTAADSTASPAPQTTTETEPETSSPPWADKESESKPDRASSPEGSEPWNLPASADTNDYSYEETVRTDNLDRTVLEAIPDRYSPDMEAHRIFDKMFDVESKKSFVDSPHRYDIDAVDEDKTYQVVQKKDMSAARQHRLAYISAAALRHKHAILEHELRLQKSLSEECEDLGVDSPSASDLFPEAELLFSGSPATDHGHERDHEPPHHHAPAPSILNETVQPAAEAQPQSEDTAPAHEEADVSLGLEEAVAVVGGGAATLDHEEFARAHPNTTFHSDDGEVQQFTLPSIKGHHITSAIFHPGRAAATVLMAAPHPTVIAQPEACEPVKYTHVDNAASTPRYVQHLNLNSVLVKDDGLTRFDGILTDTRELHLSNTASAIVHGNTTQVIRKVCYEHDKRDRFMIDESESVIAGRDAKMIAEDSRDATLNSIADESSPERNAELFWESNSASERSESRRPLDFSSDSDKCCKSPLYDETNSTDSSGVGTHLRLDSVIKEARGVDRRRSAEGSSADDTHPPLRTYPPKRSYHNDTVDRTRYSDTDRSVSGKTRAGFLAEPRHDAADIAEVRRRASNRGVVKRGCHCCNGSPVPSRPKKSRQKKSHTDLSNNH